MIPARKQLSENICRHRTNHRFILWFCWTVLGLTWPANDSQYYQMYAQSSCLDFWCSCDTDLPSKWSFDSAFPAVLGTAFSTVARSPSNAELDGSLVLGSMDLPAFRWRTWRYWQPAGRSICISVPTCTYDPAASNSRSIKENLATSLPHLDWYPALSETMRQVGGLEGPIEWIELPAFKCKEV